MNLIEPLSQRRDAEMTEVRTKAAQGDTQAKGRLRHLCRRGMLVPIWEGGK